MESFQQTGTTSGISAKLDKLIDLMQEKNSKDYKLPFGIRSKGKAASKKNKALVVFLRTNKGLEFKIGDIEDGMLKIGDYVFDCTPEDFFIYKNMPVIIQPDWSLKPYSPQEISKDNAYSQKVIIRMIERYQLEKKKANFSMWIFIALGGIAVLYILSQLLNKTPPVVK